MHFSLLLPLLYLILYFAVLCCLVLCYTMLIILFAVSLRCSALRFLLLPFSQSSLFSIKSSLLYSVNPSWHFLQNFSLHLSQNFYDCSELVDRVFGLLRSHVTCTNCKTESVTFDPYNSLSLPIPLKNTKSLTVTVQLLPIGSVPLRLDIEVSINSYCTTHTFILLFVKDSHSNIYGIVTTFIVNLAFPHSDSCNYRCWMFIRFKYPVYSCFWQGTQQEK